MARRRAVPVRQERRPRHVIGWLNHPAEYRLSTQEQIKCGLLLNVCFTPNSGLKWLWRGMSTYDPNVWTDRALQGGVW